MGFEFPTYPTTNRLKDGCKTPSCLVAQSVERCTHELARRRRFESSPDNEALRIKPDNQCVMCGGGIGKRLDVRKIRIGAKSIAQWEDVSNKNSSESS